MLLSGTMHATGGVCVCPVEFLASVHGSTALRTGMHACIYAGPAGFRIYRCSAPSTLAVGDGLTGSK